MRDDGAGFASQLHSYRQQAGMSQEELAQRSGLSARTISNLECGQVRWPYRATLSRLADALGLGDEARRDFLGATGRRLSPGDSAKPDAARQQPEPVPGRPRQLPATIRPFVGREAELAALAGFLEAGFPDDGAGAAPAPAPLVAVVSGTAGVGKTALALHWAHQAADQFPDGQLYVNLRGYDLGQPMPAADALAGFLRSAGVPGQQIPPDEDERAAHYRSLLAGQRMLIVLDNAGSADQVRPLLPGTSTCTVVVTSRDALTGLVARDGAARLDLDALPPREAVALLRTLIGPRAEAEPEATAELAGQCCRLPLALRVAAELAAARPAVPLSGLVTELADLHTRLDLLEAGRDPRAEVRTVFSWSYRHLDAADARAFRLLGLHPGPDIEPYAAAALTGATAARARQALNVLARAHLLSPAAPGRYGLHDLLRGYARELTATLDAAEGEDAALARLADHYLHTAAAAMDTLFPAQRHHRRSISRPAALVPPLGDPAAARDWLDSERAAMVATVGQIAGHGRLDDAAQLAITLDSYLHCGGYLPEASAIFQYVLDAARRTGDRVCEATALNHLGEVDWQQGRLHQAADHHAQAVALFRDAGDRASEARALDNLGLAEQDLGHCEQAARHQQEAVDIYRDLGDLFGEARALGKLGLARQIQGRYQEAARYHQQTLHLSRELGDRDGEAWALARLGVVDLRQGRYRPAAGYLKQALALFREMSHAGGEAELLVRLGQVYLGLGDCAQAAGNFEQAIALARTLGDPVIEGEALSCLGDIFLQNGQADKARAHHATALRFAAESGEARLQARAHAGLARAYHAAGDSDLARDHWHEALTRYTAIGAPEAGQISAEMAAVAQGSRRLTEEADDGRRARWP